MIKINIIYEESILFFDRLLFKTNMELFCRNVSSAELMNICSSTKFVSQ